MNKFFILIALLFSNIVSAQVVTSGLVAKYCFDGNANDAAGTRHCTVYGATLTSDRNGNANSAYSFDGLDDYIQMPNNVWASGNFSITGWILVKNFGHWSRFFEWGNGVDKDNVFFSPCEASTATSVFTIHQCSSSSRTYASSPTATFPKNVWVHVAITLSGDTARIYRDNVLWYDYKMFYVPCSTMRTKCYFGKSNFAADKSIDGKIDDVRIYNRALTSIEIDSIYKENALCQELSIQPAFADIDDILSQNAPNPVVGKSKIKLSIPQNATTTFIEFVDFNGKMVKQLAVDQHSDFVEVDQTDFAPGMYYYYLRADGQRSEGRKMVVLGR